LKLLQTVPVKLKVQNMQSIQRPSIRKEHWCC